MLRQAITEAETLDRQFRWRGQQVSRIENLSDIVFALALGMLVSASDVPRTFEALNQHLFSLGPVTLGVLFLLDMWNDHFRFFRRYAYTDGKVILLNSVLLLLVLYIAYPVRFIFDSLFGFFLGLTGNYDIFNAMNIGEAEAGRIAAYFATGYAAISLTYAMMYAHALSKADAIGLTRKERVLTRRSVFEFVFCIGGAALTFFFALFTEVRGPAAFFLFLNFLSIPISRMIFSVRKIEQEQPPASAAQNP